RGLLQAVSGSLARAGVPAVRRHQGGDRGDLSRREARRHRRSRALVLMGHGAHVRPRLGTAVAGRKRGEPAAQLPHVPVDAARGAKAQGLTKRAALFTGVSAFQMNLINILAAIIGAAVLERYPNLRIVFGESGIGWIPYALDRMDFE